jgi:peroxiredoxin
MALVHTPPADMGQACPDFNLLGVDNRQYSLSSFQHAKALVVMFLCNHCPYVKAVEQRILTLARELQEHGVQFVAIGSNDAERYPEDSFENLQKNWRDKSYPFPYLYDADQTVARRFGAVCTPDFFGYDQDRRLAYRGRLDDNWKEPEKVQRQEMRTALLEIVAGKKPSEPQTPSMGCSIKWLEE